MMFESRPIEFSKNRIKGVLGNSNVKWEICDITFDEGAFLATEVHQTTAVLVLLQDIDLPRFEIEKEGWLKRILDFAKREEISFDDEKFTDDFAVKGQNPEKVKTFFTKEIIQYLSDNNRYHIEGNENGLLVFQNYRFASSAEVEELLQFTRGLVDKITNSKQIIA